MFNACKSGNEKIVEYLVEHGADVKIKNDEGETILFIACEGRNESLIENLVKYLVEHGIDITIENEYGETALFYACMRENKKNSKIFNWPRSRY